MDTPQKQAVDAAPSGTVLPLFLLSDLIVAVMADDVAEVEAALAAQPASINDRDREGNTAVHLATDRGILVRLLYAGPDLTLTNNAHQTASAYQLAQHHLELSAITLMFYAAAAPVLPVLVVSGLKL